MLSWDQNFADWIAPLDTSENLAGVDFFTLAPEFFGQEEILAQVRSGKRTQLRLENINRTLPNGETRYFTFTVISARNIAAPAAWVILITDTTVQGRRLQELMQNRNELSLMQNKINKLNTQLNFLLRRYVAADVAEALLKGELRPELGGELRDVSILFADVRDFTRTAASLPPAQVMRLLNAYLNVVADAIDTQAGTINQFEGDNVMAIFNAHGHQPDHAMRAVQAGIAIQRAVHGYQQQRPAAELRLCFGVGINSGPAIVGNTGAHWRYDFSAIGDTVNLASRITAVTPRLCVWISETTHKQLPATIQVTKLPPRTFKGKSAATSLYQAHIPELDKDAQT